MSAGAASASGATTSKVHTAVKIAPNYDGAVVHVTDASRAVGVVGNLLSKTAAEGYLAGVRADYEKVRAAHARGRADKEKLPLARARANRAAIAWDGYAPPQPLKPGMTVFDDYDLAELVTRIDWTPFFRVWELAGTWPHILEDPVVGETATAVYGDALAMLQRIVGEKWLTAKGVIGLWPANSVDDDVEIFADESRSGVLGVVHTLRQQMVRTRDRPNLALADYVAPRETGLADWMGGFVVTAGHGIEPFLAEFAAAHDDYNAILLKALADRLAEAFAERLHERVRREFWGYAPDEHLTNDDLIAEEYRGIRPAPGYPACPDHTEKPGLFRLLDAEHTVGVTLTESMAMVPTAAVSGYYFAHPEARYFGVGRIHRDQVEDYARRKGMDVAAMERWLAPNLAYDPELADG